MKDEKREIRVSMQLHGPNVFLSLDNRVAASPMCIVRLGTLHINSSRLQSMEKNEEPQLNTVTGREKMTKEAGGRSIDRSGELAQFIAEGDDDLYHHFDVKLMQVQVCEQLFRVTSSSSSSTTV